MPYLQHKLRYDTSAALETAWSAASCETLDGSLPKHLEKRRMVQQGYLERCKMYEDCRCVGGVGWGVGGQEGEGQAGGGGSGPRGYLEWCRMYLGCRRGRSRLVVCMWK